jgi:putative tryptophan/tyrosine transport system substrate-binding protein
MRRRDVLSLLGGAAVSWPVGAHGQHRPKVARLGALLFSTPQADPQMAAVHTRLQELGYVEGQSLVIMYRYAEGNYERLPELAAELARQKPDLLLALGGDVAPYVAKATSTIPIVFVSSADPVQLGLAVSLARPQGNATGVTLLLDDTASKRLELLKEAAPQVQRAAFLWNPDHPDNELTEAQRAAQALKIELHPVEMHGSSDLESALRGVNDAHCDALYVVSSRHTVLNIPRIVEFATANRLPLAGGWGAWARAGGLLSFGPNATDMARRTADHVDKIIRGAKPTDLPIEQPTKFEFVLNAKAAKTIGIELPAALLARADEVIE